MSLSRSSPAPSSSPSSSNGPSSQLLPLPSSDASAPCCWICLGDESDGALGSFCACPSRLAHAPCIARWQLQQAGKSEERHCRFCNEQLPDYQTALSRDRDGAADEAAPGSSGPSGDTPLPVIHVHYGNVVIVMPLQPGEEGKVLFEAEVRRVLSTYGLKPTQKIKINFECKALPGMPGPSVKLEGIKTYDAAFWCASQHAANRQPVPCVAEREGAADPAGGAPKAGCKGGSFGSWFRSLAMCS